MNIDEVTGPSNIEKEYKRTIAHMALVREWWDEISAIKELIANDQTEAARSVFDDLREDVRIGLWRATTKGGCWTIKERDVLKPETRMERT